MASSFGFSLPKNSPDVFYCCEKKTQPFFFADRFLYSLFDHPLGVQKSHTSTEGLNVLLTRARRGLVIIGASRTLQNDASWKADRSLYPVDVLRKWFEFRIEGCGCF